MNASGVSVRHINSETCITTCYSQIPSQHLKGDWQEEAGFETGRSVTVKISDGCIVLMADGNECRSCASSFTRLNWWLRGCGT